MNRLWIRISLVIVIIVLFGMLLPVVVGIGIREFRTEESWTPPDLQGEIDPEILQERREERSKNFIPGRFVLNNMAPILIGATIISIVAGILLSRSISAPLSKLAEAARSIGQHDLNHRVEVRGTQEIQEVARAFNKMADEFNWS